MEKDTKRVWHLPYCFLEPGELERKFARLAAQGWLLEKCTYGTYTYRRGTPNEYEYRVQYIYESRDGQRADYVKTLADIGVEKVGDATAVVVVHLAAEAAQIEFLRLHGLDPGTMFRAAGPWPAAGKEKSPALQWRRRGF
jgi:hypothetical protein